MSFENVNSPPNRWGGWRAWLFLTEYNFTEIQNLSGENVDYDSTLTVGVKLDLIYPYVVPKSWVEYAGADDLVSWPFSDDVRMVIVVDGKGTVRNLRPHELDDLGETVESIFDVAARNLARSFEKGEFELGAVTLIDGVQVGCARGNWMAPAGGLILGTLYEAMKEQFGADDFAAIAVNQECLLAFPTDERTLASKSLRIAIEDQFSGHRKPVSRTWLKLHGGWPGEHPLNGAFGTAL